MCVCVFTVLLLACSWCYLQTQCMNCVCGVCMHVFIYTYIHIYIYIYIYIHAGTYTCKNSQSYIISPLEFDNLVKIHLILINICIYSCEFICNPFSRIHVFIYEYCAHSLQITVLKPINVDFRTFICSNVNKVFFCFNHRVDSSGQALRLSRNFNIVQPDSAACSQMFKLILW